MFSGIIEAVGTIDMLERRGQDAHVRVAAAGLDLADVKLGDSIAVNGVCLTVTALASGAFDADISAETLARTTLGRLRQGGKVNLEKALALGERLGGHLVSGHVDGVGRLTVRESQGQSIKMVFSVPEPLARYIAKKGSICIDGVSLTVNEVEGARFAVNLIPHTLSMTTLDLLRVDSEVNLEVDLIARYLERLLHGTST